MAGDEEGIFYRLTPHEPGIFRTLSLLLVILAIRFHSAAQVPFAVVELFTSEGCNSCPTADHVLSELKSEAAKSGQQVYFLEYHVDYWNRSGWKDPYSRNQFTLRQENYSRVLPGKEMYTPQVVINGRTELTGTSREAVQAAVKKEMRNPAVELKLVGRELRNDTLRIRYTLPRNDPNATVKAAVTEDKLESDVRSGENKGKKLRHDAVVRLLYSTQSAMAAGEILIPLKGLVPKTGMQLTVFVQQKQTMHIVAAVQSAFE